MADFILSDIAGTLFAIFIRIVKADRYSGVGKILKIIVFNQQVPSLTKHDGIVGKSQTIIPEHIPGYNCIVRKTI